MPGVRLIAGSGRSGTTWVQDALATANGLRPIFEPLHPHVSAVGNRYAFSAIGPGDDHPELARFLEEVCGGLRNRIWTQYRRQRRWLIPPPDEFSSMEDAARVYRRWGKFLKELPRLAAASRRSEPLVKCIRANLMLGWLSRRLGFRVVLIVRHPGAVIESELRSGWNAAFALDRFRKDARLDELTGGRYRALLERPLQPVEALVMRWVVENQWVAERAEEDGVTVVHYEHLKFAPDREWNRIRHALDLENAPPHEVITRPSQQSDPRKSAAAASVAEPRWLRALSADHVSRIQAILDEADVGLYSMSDPEPRNLGLEQHAESGARAAP